MILFVDPGANGGGADYVRETEKFYNPKIKKVSVTLDGNSNQLYSSGMLPHQNFKEIRKHFADGKQKTIPHVIKESELSDMSIEDYLTTKYGLWLDFRSTNDSELHGSGKRLEGVSQSVKIEIHKTAETDGNLDAYVYYIQDAQLVIENGQLQNVMH